MSESRDRVVRIGGRAAGLAPVLLAVAVATVSAEGAVVRLAVETPTASWAETHVWSAHAWTIDTEARAIVIDLDAGLMRATTRPGGATDVRTLGDVRRRVAQAHAAGRRLVRRVGPSARTAPIIAAANPAFRFTVRRTGAPTTVAGVRAVPYRIESAVLAGRVWIAPGLPMPPEAARWMALAVDVGGVRLAGSKLAAALARLGGFPVRMELRTADGGSWSVTATAIEPSADDG